MFNAACNSETLGWFRVTVREKNILNMTLSEQNDANTFSGNDITVLIQEEKQAVVRYLTLI